MLGKKLFGVVSIGLVATALSAAAFAGGPTMEAAPAPVSDSGFTLGMDAGTYGAGNTNYALMFGYVNEDFLADLGVGYGSVLPSAGNEVSVWDLRGYLGLRHSIMHSLYFTYGALGNYGIISNTTANRVDPYSVGAFVGLDYQPMPQLLLSFKISPYSYQRFVSTATGNAVFTTGSIGASYVFAS